jgi:tRNA-Thr(GGU) m(6)t(6)A37 methyltransferase TsaA
MGFIESCFPEKFSVPRQGNLLELTRAKIKFPKNFDMSSFEGIEDFDYIWIVYVFHLNTNFGKSKISPPKFEGKKLGVFATRSPHRLNPIGLTLAKFERIEKNEMYISSVDMISGTPVIDIKPYHHLESIPLDHYKYPDWIKNADVNTKKASVIFSDTSLENLKHILSNKKLNFYDKFEDIINLIKGVLEIDPHSKYTQKKKDTMLYAFYVDKLNVIYEYNAADKVVNIHNIEYSEEYKKLRNKSWLENYNKHN